MYSFQNLFILACSFLATFGAANPAPILRGVGGSLINAIQDLPLLNCPLPSMVTNDVSPECAEINQGTRLCCQSTLDGGAPIVSELAAVVGYKLDPNSINGIYCKKDPVCAKGTDLCCQVDTFTQVLPELLSLALYCDDAPKEPLRLFRE